MTFYLLQDLPKDTGYVAAVAFLDKLETGTPWPTKVCTLNSPIIAHLILLIILRFRDFFTESPCLHIPYTFIY